MPFPQLYATLPNAIIVLLCCTNIVVALSSMPQGADVCDSIGTRRYKTFTFLLTPLHPDQEAVVGRLENCFLNNVDLILLIPAYNGTFRGTTYVSIRNVRMLDGSLVIKPHSTGQGGKNPRDDLGAFGLLHNIQIDVENVLTEKSGGFAVLDTKSDDPVDPKRPYTISNVTINVLHSYLHAGTVASIIASHDAWVRDVHIKIQTNTTVRRAVQFVASIVAGGVFDSSLILNSGNVFDESHGECRGGPVALEAGFDTSITDVGILSVGLSHANAKRPPSSTFQLGNFKIFVTDGLRDCALGVSKLCPKATNPIMILATSKTVASIASVCFTPPPTGGASLIMDQATVSISVLLSNAPDGVHHKLNTVGALHQAALGSVAVVGWTDSASLTMTGSTLTITLQITPSTKLAFPEENLGSVTMSFSGDEKSRGSVFFGVTVYTHPDVGNSITALTRSSVALAVRLENTHNVHLASSDVNGTVAGITTATDGGISASSLVYIEAESNFTIAPFFSDTSNITVSATNSFGIVSQSTPAVVAQRYHQHGSSLVVDATSQVSILAFINSSSTQSTIITSLSLQSRDQLPYPAAQALLGISIANFHGKVVTNSNATVAMDGRVHINVYIGNGASLQGGGGAFALLGLSLYSGKATYWRVGPQATLNVSIGLASSNVNAEGNYAVAGGLIATAASKFEPPSNTALHFCGDPGRVVARLGVALNVQPSTTGVSFTNSISCVGRLETVFSQFSAWNSSVSVHHPSSLLCGSSQPHSTATTSHTPTRTVIHQSTPSATAVPLPSRSATQSLTQTFPPQTTNTGSPITTQTQQRSTTPTSSVSVSMSRALSATAPPPPPVIAELSVEDENTTTISAERRDTVGSQKTTVTVVSSTVLVISAVNSGGPGLQDVQALVVLGSMACATEEVQTISSGGEKSVVPFELPLLEEGSRSRTMVSNVVVILAVALVQVLVAATIKARKDKNFVEACGLARFPAWSFSVFVVLYQGTILTAFRGLFSPSTTTDRILGAVLVSVSFTVPLISLVLQLRGQLRSTFIVYENAFANAPTLFRLLVFPVGFFDGSPDVDPDCIVRRFSTMFSGVRDNKNPFFTTIGFVKAFVVAFIAALPPDSLGCTTRFALIGIICFVVAVVVGVWRPFRVSLNNVLSVLSNLCTAALCFASVKPEAIESSRVASIVTATVGLGLVASIAGITMKMLEALKWKKEEQRQRGTDILQTQMLTFSTSEPKRSSGKTDDDDIELKDHHHLLVDVAENPLLGGTHRPDSDSSSHSGTSTDLDDDDHDECSDDNSEFSDDEEHKDSYSTL